MPQLWEQAFTLVDDQHRKYGEKRDYRWVVGLAMRQTIFQGGVAITEVTPTSASEWESEQAFRWAEYQHLVPDDAMFLNFVSCPAIARCDVEPTMAVLLRDGIPCGAIHCEEIETWR